MNRTDFSQSYLDLSASEPDSFSPPGLEPTVQIPLPPPTDLKVHITPGGARRDWQLARHVAAGIGFLLLLVLWLAKQPAAPPRVAVRPMATPLQQPLPVSPVPRPLPPQSAPPSYYVPQPPAMFQSPQTSPEFPVTPPSGAAQVEIPVASRTDSGADLPTVYGRVGFAVPPAVPLPPDSLVSSLLR